MRRTNPRKAAGPDNIPGRALRVCSAELAEVLTDIYNLSLSRSTDDAVNTSIRTALTHLENKDTYV